MLEIIKKKPHHSFLLIKIILILLILIGISDTIWLTYNDFYFSGECQVLDSWFSQLGGDCGEVTNSSYSKFMGFPLSVWGLIGYLSILIITIKSFFNHRYIFYILFTVGVGVLISTYLLFIQFLILKQWCPLCITSFLTMLFLLVTIIFWLVSLQNLSIDLMLVKDFIFIGIFVTSLILLAYKVFEDSSLNPQKKVSDNSQSTKVEGMPDSYPAGIIDGEIIFLKDIDQKLNELTAQFPFIKELHSSNTSPQFLSQLRKKTLYLMGLEKVSLQGIDKNELVKNVSELSKSQGWNGFLKDYYSYLESTALQGVISNYIRIEENIPDSPTY